MYNLFLTLKKMYHNCVLSRVPIISHFPVDVASGAKNNVFLHTGTCSVVSETYIARSCFSHIDTICIAIFPRRTNTALFLVSLLSFFAFCFRTLFFCQMQMQLFQTCSFSVLISLTCIFFLLALMSYLLITQKQLIFSQLVTKPISRF